MVNLCIADLVQDYAHAPPDFKPMEDVSVRCASDDNSNAGSVRCASDDISSAVPEETSEMVTGQIPTPTDTPPSPNYRKLVLARKPLDQTWRKRHLTPVPPRQCTHAKRMCLTHVQTKDI